MCRMMAVLGSGATTRELLTRFRAEADIGRVGRGMQPGHRDGWGIVTGDPVRYAGRAPTDAARDPAYEAAVRAIPDAARAATLVHFRKATAGGIALENTHPFIADGLAFAHNGTVRGYVPAGQNDSIALFGRLREARSKGASIAEALRALDREVARYTFTSLTLLVTDGRETWGLRRIGNDPVACAPEACPADYYTLGHATMPDGSVVVSQEHEVMGIRGWTAVPDGAIVHVAADGRVSVQPAAP